MTVVGSVRVIETGAPALQVDGRCLKGTLASLGSGSKPMTPVALAKIEADALDLLSLVVTSYEAIVAKGEVGASGSAIASAAIPMAPATGLLYGRIQSGKTVAMIALVAAAIDNGFRVVVVLTSDNVKLVGQTTGRFAALEGPITVDALESDGWAADDKHIAKYLGKVGLVVVCSKNSTRLEDLIEFLQKVGAPDYPALILDDEADQATPDTNLAKSKRGNEKVGPTAIYTRVAEELTATLRHHVFLQVTATPYALLLQSVGTTLRPSFTRLLEPGEGYTGGEYFFEQLNVEGPTAPLVFVPSDESQAILDESDEAPEGLRKAIAFFLVAAAVQSITDPDTAKGGQNFVCHTSQLQDQHSKLEQLIRDYLERISNALETRAGEPLDKLTLAYDELGKTLPERPSLPVVLDQIGMRIVNRKVLVMNGRPGKKAPEPSRGVNFIIGGNIIGRGVTIDNLLVTYYLREPKTGQMDTMLQHARMYGYRQRIMPLTRVFLPEQLAVRFHEIHKIEQRLRRHLKTADMSRPIPIERAKHLNPTRRTVLDPTYIDAFDATDQVFPTHPDLKMKSKEFQGMTARVKELVGGQFSNDAQLEQISFDELLTLVEDLPYNDKETSNSWVPSVLVKVLEHQRERVKGRAYIYTRKMAREATHFVGGALSGTELADIRQMDGPVICAFRDDGTHIRKQPANQYWYPTLVFDRDMKSLLINVTPDAE
ncbi:MAG TPA: Z1 domain-containing protein [Kofleriaceae bacterium]|jgi:hypothetical protein